MFPVRAIAGLLILGPRSALSFTATSHLHRLHDRTALSAIASEHEENQLHLLTFDLDDTIFPIGPVVADANVAQLQTLLRFGFDGACNEQIIAASKQIRTELRETGDVVTYTDLRKLSIRREIERVTGLEGGLHDSVVEAVFDAWLTERHASADRNLFPHASNALQAIRERHPGAVIAAITNGRGNPLEMPSVKEYFDFSVSGEDEGVFPKRKPDEGIYRAALEKYNQMKQHNDDIIWLHVGDDLANDVGASAAVGAKAIWLAAEEDESSDLPSWSTATKEEMQKRAAMDEMAREHVSARIRSLEELPNAIMKVLGS